VVLSVFITLLLLVFQPFGLNNMPNNKLLIISGYGVISFFIIALVNIGAFKVFKSFFDEQKWTTGRESLSILMMILLIGFANFIYTYMIGVANFNFSNLVRFEIYAFIIGLFPTFLLVFYSERRLNKVYASSSVTLNQQINKFNEKAGDEMEDTLVEIPSNNTTLNLDSNDFLYAAAADNYCQIHHIKEGTVERSMIRISMKQLDAIWSKNQQITRCHKSYIVNLNHVESISGNAQGYKLHLEQSDQLIPVSRSKNKEIKLLLKSYAKD